MLIYLIYIIFKSEKEIIFGWEAGYIICIHVKIVLLVLEKINLRMGTWSNQARFSSFDQLRMVLELTFNKMRLKPKVYI